MVPDIVHRLIPFTIDGQLYEVSDPKQTAGALLRLADLNPETFDLARVSKEGSPDNPFKDDDVVTVQKDDRFTALRESAPVG